MSFWNAYGAIKSLPTVSETLGIECAEASNLVSYGMDMENSEFISNPSISYMKQVIRNGKHYTIDIAGDRKLNNARPHP